MKVMEQITFLEHTIHFIDVKCEFEKKIERTYRFIIVSAYKYMTTWVCNFLLFINFI